MMLINEPSTDPVLVLIGYTDDFKVHGVKGTESTNANVCIFYLIVYSIMEKLNISGNVFLAH